MSSLPVEWTDGEELVRDTCMGQNTQLELKTCTTSQNSYMDTINFCNFMNFTEEIIQILCAKDTVIMSH